LGVSLGHLFSDHFLLSQAGRGDMNLGDFTLVVVDGHVVDDMNSSFNVFVGGSMALAVNAAL